MMRNAPVPMDWVTLEDLCGWDSEPPWASKRRSKRHRLESDLTVLRRLVSESTLRTTFCARIRNDEPGVLPEIFAAALLSDQALDITFSVPNSNGKNYDFRLTYEDLALAVEVKHQKDAFPFKDRHRVSTDDGDLFIGVRRTADSDALGLTKPETGTVPPASLMWRSTVGEAVRQLPTNECCVVALSVDAMSDFEEDITDALFGDLYLEATLAPSGVGSIHATKRLGNGLFRTAESDHVAGVLAFKLYPDTTDSTQSVVWAKWFRNPHCAAAGAEAASTLMMGLAGER